MSERGVFAVDRGIFDHPKLQEDRPFSRREAWLWLISAAAWKPHTRRVSGRIFELKRGQLVASTRYMAERWHWSEPTVRRFLTLLKTDADGDAEIDATADAGVTVITIRKYNKYQRVSLPSDAGGDAASDAHSNAPATQRRRNKQDIQDKESNSSLRSAPSGAPIYTDSRHELWGEGVQILSSLGIDEKRARNIIGRWLKDVRDDAQAVLGAIQRARDHRIIDPVPWITQALKSPTKSPTNGERTYEKRAAQVAGSAAAGTDPIVDGMRRIAGRIAQRKLAERPGDRNEQDGLDLAGRQDARRA